MVRRDNYIKPIVNFAIDKCMKQKDLKNNLATLLDFARDLCQTLALFLSPRTNTERKCEKKVGSHAADQRG